MNLRGLPRKVLFIKGQASLKEENRAAEGCYDGSEGGIFISEYQGSGAHSEKRCATA